MIRIAITGPESCGKTTLAHALSEKLNAHLFLEFGRVYLEQLDRAYVQEDLDRICEGHLEQFGRGNARESVGVSVRGNEECEVVDTDFIVLKIWSMVKYGNVSENILREIEANHFDLHILCSPDIPWEYDPQREHPEMREELFGRYVEELTQHQKKFIIVSGTLEERIEKSCSAIAAIQSE